MRKSNVIITVTILFVVLAIALGAIFILKSNNRKSGENLSAEEIVAINSDIIRKKVKLEKDATDNIAAKIQESGIEGQIKVKKYKKDSNDVYIITIADENNKKYELSVSKEGYFGTIVDENGKYLYYEKDD